jgi:signal transduction histidine kinase
MSPKYNARIVFALAALLLVVSGIAACFTLIRLGQTQAWVGHTRDVQVALGQVDATLAVAGRNRTAYLRTGDATYLALYNSAVPAISATLSQLCVLTRDNPVQRARCADLQDTVNQRLALWRASIDLWKANPQDLKGQTDLAMKGLAFAQTQSSIDEQMRAEEAHLLDLREQRSRLLFKWAIVVLCTSFAVALWLLSIHYRFLMSELESRLAAENSARESEQSLRLLTIRLLQLQDEERRKFSRELHDSLGQYLVSAKMNLDLLSRTPSCDPLLADAIRSLDQAIAETRTISHLLHPPLLDEVGFVSAAKWYIDGFAQRSGIEVIFDMPAEPPRLPQQVNIVLFRILQESLTNIHRHAVTDKADIRLTYLPERVSLTVRDYGKGIAPELLRTFVTKGINVGVGLAGMRERARELGGEIKISSTSSGTTLLVDIPLRAKVAEDLYANQEAV